jgi:asparagine synthase (glutamine-hydrolysing)
MSGFAGVAHLDGRPVTRALLDDLYAPIAHRGPDHVDAWSHGPHGLIAGVFRVTPEAADERQPVIGVSGAVLSFDGRLDDRERLADALGADRSLTDPELTLVAYERYGEDFVEHLDGEWAVAIIDAVRGTTFLARDPVGTRPLYFCRTNRALVFGSEIKAVLQHPDVPRSANEDLLAYYLLQGPARDNAWDTFFRDISTVFPGYILRERGGQVTRRRYWDFDPSLRLRLPSYGDYVEAFRERFETAVRRRMRSSSPVAVSVSGGLDSSSILCVALDLRAREPRSNWPELVGITHASAPATPSYEGEYIEAIERRWSIAVDSVPLRAEGIYASGREQAWIREMPLLSELWATGTAFVDLVRSRGCRSYLTGHWGDQFLFEQVYLVDLLDRLRLVELARHLRGYVATGEAQPLSFYLRRFGVHAARWHVPKTLVPPARALHTRFASLRRDQPWYTDELRRHAYGDPPKRTLIGPSRTTVHARNLYAKIRSKYYMLAMEADAKIAAHGGVELGTPYLDRDLIAFLMAVPGEVTGHGGLQRSLLRDSMKGVLPDQIRQRHTKADFTALANRALLDDLIHLPEIVSPQSISVGRGYIARHELLESLPALKERASGADAMESAGSDLLGLESWLYAFFPAERDR